MRRSLTTLCAIVASVASAQQINYTYNGSNGAAGLGDYGIATQSNSGQATIGAEGIGDIYANLNLGSNISGIRRFWHISKRSVSENHDLSYYFFNGSTFQHRVTFASTGNVGIGTAAPNSKLEVVGPATGTGATIRVGGGGDLLLNSGGTVFFDGNYSYASGNYIRPTAANTQSFVTSGLERLKITSSGDIGIGTSSPTQKLTVNGTIYGKEVKVDLAVPGPDYVFEEDYKLTPLEDIKTYIDQYKHLPEVPSAKEMERDGIQLGEMNMLLLKKIEELTLYVIDLNRKNEEIKNEMKKIKNKR